MSSEGEDAASPATGTAAHEGGGDYSRTNSCMEATAPSAPARDQHPPRRQDRTLTQEQAEELLDQLAAKGHRVPEERRAEATRFVCQGGTRIVNLALSGEAEIAIGPPGPADDSELAAFVAQGGGTVLSLCRKAHAAMPQSPAKPRCKDRPMTQAEAEELVAKLAVSSARKGFPIPEDRHARLVDFALEGGAATLHAGLEPGSLVAVGPRPADSPLPHEFDPRSTGDPGLDQLVVGGGGLLISVCPYRPPPPPAPSQGQRRYAKAVVRGEIERLPRAIDMRTLLAATRRIAAWACGAQADDTAVAQVIAKVARARGIDPAAHADKLAKAYHEGTRRPRRGPA